MVIETTTVAPLPRFAGAQTFIPPPPYSPPPALTRNKRANLTAPESDAKSHESGGHGGQTKPQLGKQSARRHYIDELGFYRFLDDEQRHYVCSNVNIVNSATTPRGPQRAASGSPAGQHGEQQQQRPATRRSRISSGGAGVEECFKSVRRDLGISHFDKTEDYENWKRGWDEFLRVRLISQQPVTLNRDLKNRVRSGIPHDYRCKVWTALIRMRTRVLRSTFGEDIYQAIISDLVSKISIPSYPADQRQEANNNTAKAALPAAGAKQERPGGAGDGRRATGSSYIGPLAAGSLPGRRPAQAQRILVHEPLLDQCFKQIELDLLRTLPNNRHFEDPNSIGIQRVRRVLRAYSCFNPQVGYCQGMNRLAAMALLVLPEEEAFWCLVAIIQCIMPNDYYLKPWLAQVDCCVLGDLLAKRLPRLHAHLAANDIQLTLFSWFFTIFVDGFRPELLLRIWDLFLVEGDKVLFRVALAILHITQDELLTMREFSEMSAHLNRLASTRELDIEQLFASEYRQS